ncbi:hypothetical protein H9Q69_006452 [Fusarium xylarioides]|nr:hypothetical protein H9Q69_006452 [Fusarium xylarioides]
MAAVGSDVLCASGSETIDSLHLTYKAAQQITETLWANERDENLRSFCASLMAYFNMIKRSLSILDNKGVPDADNSLITMLLAPIRFMFPASCFEGPVKDRLRELKQLGDSIALRAKNGPRTSTNIALVDLTRTYESRDNLLKSLAMCEETLRDSYLEDLSRWDAEDFSPQLVIAELPYGISNAAQSMFEAMVACTDCPCKTEHDFGARLYLGTHRKSKATLSVEDEDVIDFDMFLSTECDWQEVRVHAWRNKVVQIVTGPTSDPHSKRKRTEAKSLKIKRLCETVAKIKSMAAYRLELKVLRNQLFQLQPEVCNSAIDASQNAVSLEYILRHRKGFFTERTKRILAVILASTVFHLYDTPWLQSTWGSPDILFFRTSSSTILFRPFINTHLPNLHALVVEAPPKSTNPKDSLEDTEDPDLEDFFTHPCPTVITLASVLLEVYFETPLDILAQKFNVKLGTNTQPSAFTKYMDANLVFQACRREIPQNSQFYLALTNCLDPSVWQDEDGHLLDTLTLRATLYQQVILPLETELSQAYSSIPIEELDKFAQELDFGRWGHLNHNKDADSQESVINTHGSTSLEHRLSSAVPDYPVDRPNNGHDLSDSRLDMQAYPHSAYTVGIICALPLELRAVRALFDTEHNEHTRMKGDSNTYALGTMGQHMIVAACLPSGEYGTNAAAEVASNMKRTYHELEFCLLVGIGGGAPSPDIDIRLGDVVVSLPTPQSSGVIQYDRGKEYEEIHYGLIASGNRVLKDAVARDRWAKEHGILCFEMEAAGVVNTLPCLVIRGICDYADSYKNKRWQNYAAATAASYAKLLLQHTASRSIERKAA